MKGISLIEQHVEKLVVAILAIVLMAVLAMQFLTAPNRVSMGGEEVNPSEIEGRLRAKADAINGRLGGGGTDAPLVEGGIPKVADDFVSGLDRGVSPRTRLPQIDHALANSLLPGDVSSGDATYHVPRFAPLAMLDVRQESATIAESEVVATPGLKEFLSASGEVDVTWSIPVARVDLKGLRAELRGSRDGATAIPDLWYNGNLYLVDLVFERQRMGEQGWGEAEVVSPLPGRFSLRKELASDKVDAVLRDEVFRLLGSRERAMQILQPDFYETVRDAFSASAILGDATSASAPAESDEVRRVRKNLATKSANLKRVEADLTALGGPLRGPDEKDKRKDGRDSDADGSGGGGGGNKTPGSGMGFGSGTAGGKRGVGGSGADDEATRAKRRLLTAQVDRLTAEVKRLTDEFERLAPDGAAVQAPDADDLSKADAVLVWAHDLAVKPGASYRYRARLAIYNPFFARTRQLSAEQAELAKAFTLPTAVSEWSEPVAIEPEVTFFLVDATPGEGRLGLGTAKFEVFRYLDGERRRETFTVQPGDRIGDERETGKDKREVDFGTEWFVVDVLEGLPVEARTDSKGRSARVLVSDGQGVSMVRMAVRDLVNPLRVKFNDQVEEAKLAASTPTPPTGEPAGSGAPPMTPTGGPAGGGGPGAPAGR
jgi:hypothetical protein